MEEEKKGTDYSSEREEIRKKYDKKSKKKKHLSVVGVEMNMSSALPILAKTS